MIISIAGRAESGKSTSAKIMKEVLEGLNKKVMIIHYGDHLKFLAEKYFGWDGSKDEEGRALLQWLGTDKVRAIKPTYWVDHVAGIVDLFKDDFDYFIMPDCRFLTEVERFDLLGYPNVNLHIERLGHENALTEEQRQHPSETALNDYEFDYYIKCITGLEYLEKEVITFLNWLINEREQF